MIAGTFRRQIERFPRLKRTLVRVRYGKESWEELTRRGHGPHSGPLLFTIQKCASTYVKRAMAIAAMRNGWSYSDYEALFWHTRDAAPKDALALEAPRLMAADKSVFGPFRDYFEAPNQAGRPIVLVLRDPRDVLVSAYFSRRHSHAVPGGMVAADAFLEARSLAASMTVDTFALYALEEFGQKYEDFATHLLGRPNVTFLTYEQMRRDFQSWCRSLLEGLGFPADPGTLEALRVAYEDGGEAPSGDVLKHRRRGVPGEFRDALSPRTVDELNARLAPLLARFAVWPQ